jgi:CRP-like cAMP-binding protein
MEYDLLIQNHPLFKNLSNKQIQKLISTCNKIELKVDDILIQEGDNDKQCYLLLNGTLDVIRNDQEKTIHHLAQLGRGDVVGGIVLLDEKTRSATVRCITDCEMLVIQQKNIEELIAQDKDFYHVLKNIGALICHQFRETNEKTVQGLREKIEMLKIQVTMGRMLVGIIILLSFLSFFNLIAAEYLKRVGGTTYITRPLMVVLMLFLIYVFKSVRLPLSTYGISSKGSGRALRGGLLYSIPICLLVILIKWLLIRYVPSYSSKHLFSPQPIIIGNILLYVLLIAPFQELLARSGLQVPLEHLLTGRYRVLVAILASTLVFMTAHAFISPFIASLVFLPGVYFGWLFYKYKNIIAPTIAHGIMGVWGFNIVGFT